MNSIGYYPGCSSGGGGIELEMSIRALSAVAGVELIEADDWNCCGASAAHNISHALAVALPYRILALAEAQGLDTVLAPCAACFARLKGTHARVTRSEALLAEMTEITGRPYAGSINVININEYLNLLLADGLADKLPRSLGGLKVAAYYGCLLSRDDAVITGDDHEAPTGMLAAIRAAGADPVDWNYAVECCGAGFSMSKTDAVVDLTSQILADAADNGAEAVITGCPMCHSNLDMRQKTIRQRGKGDFRMPILYLSELLGLAAGVAPKALGLNRHFVDAMGVTEWVTDTAPGATDEPADVPAGARSN